MELRLNARDAVAALESLLDRVSEHGDTVVIERDGKPVGRLTPAVATEATVRPRMRELVELLHGFAQSDHNDGWVDGVAEAVRLGNEPASAESPWDR